MLLAAGVTARAQGPTTGAVAGRVEDATGAAVAGAQVDAEETATHHHQTARSDGTGRFALVSLTPGGYRIVVSATGLAEAETAIEVGIGSTAEVVTRLTVAEAHAETTVTAATTPESTAAAVQAFDREGLEVLPLDGRRWQSVALLTPQANPATTDGELLSFSGLPPTANSTRIDGMDADQSYGGVPRGRAGQRAGGGGRERDERGGARGRAGVRGGRGDGPASGDAVCVFRGGGAGVSGDGAE